MPDKGDFSREVTQGSSIVIDDPWVTYQKRSVYMLRGKQVLNLLTCHERVAAHETNFSIFVIFQSYNIWLDLASHSVLFSIVEGNLSSYFWYKYLQLSFKIFQVFPVWMSVFSK